MTQGENIGRRAGPRAHPEHQRLLSPPALPLFEWLVPPPRPVFIRPAQSGPRSPQYLTGICPHFSHPRSPSRSRSRPHRDVPPVSMATTTLGGLAGLPGGCLRSGAGAAPPGIALAGIAPVARGHGTGGTGQRTRDTGRAVPSSLGAAHSGSSGGPLGSWRRISRQAAGRGSLSPPSWGAAGEEERGRGPGAGLGGCCPRCGAAGGRGAPGARWMARSGAETRRDGADVRRMVPVAGWGLLLERG